ncbi:serine O-acetyltransferase [Capnocytophaga catalasegens]|uniref:Serine O-acetyltransferase n=1 Tax=Capnocytophaga catalasegens TaxID=1004260 RepID=A0AAV5ATG4_9FLAO|nr:serine O-acetyltransferase [Capnocytophaga catalasegens]GIZ14744.1 hypothetical protein RCZ03_07440 [Capnocytophaga catalasegens]GJM50592.1 hypothetical protein RCZ15_15650 [Capnocytophaga catalasegens]GJM53577.1 hypothetical protein RCZ16_18930 [Capnocytophaga catalasegens]
MEKLVDLLHKQHQGLEVALNKQRAEQFVDKLYRLFFRLDVNSCSCKYEIEQQLKIIQLELVEIIYQNINNSHISEEKASYFFKQLPHLYQLLLEDAKTLYENDPATQQLEEIYISYPGFYATVVYRLAHCIWEIDLKLLARLWSEYAHSKTGIDIHPGASIGEKFCIDHGTGIVIGETSIIGNNVKIYQGVTLGALSVSKDKANKVRHPKIGDNVVIYSGATILGGNTEIGHDSIIGGNVWLTESIEPYTIVYYKSEMIIKQKETSSQPIFFSI